MVCLEMPPAATFTTDVRVPGVQASCAEAGSVEQAPEVGMAYPQRQASVIVTCPAGTWIVGEHAPAGTTNGPGFPGGAVLTVKEKSPVTGGEPVDSLQISRKPVSFSLV